MDNNRYTVFDNLRALSIIGVVMIHITAPLVITGDNLNLVLNQISRFAVPVFFLLSGWGLVTANSYERSNGYTNFIRKRINKIIPPYIIWNVIFILYRNLLNLITGGEFYGFWKFIIGLFLGNNYGHFYFVPVIMLLYLVYPLLLKYGKSNFSLFLFFIITVVSQYANEITGYEMFNAAQNVFNWILYFVFGIWLATDFEYKLIKLKRYKKYIAIFFIISMLIIIIESYWSSIQSGGTAIITTAMRPTMIPYSILLTFLLIAFSVDEVKILNIFSKHSFEIYLSHNIFISVLSNAFILIIANQ